MYCCWKHWHNYRHILLLKTMTQMLTYSVVQNIGTNTFIFFCWKHWHKHRCIMLLKLFTQTQTYTVVENIDTNTDIYCCWKHWHNTDTYCYWNIDTNSDTYCFENIDTNTNIGTYWCSHGFVCMSEMKICSCLKLLVILFLSFSLCDRAVLFWGGYWHSRCSW